MFGDTRNDEEYNPCRYKTIQAILLDPTAWKAVGKTRRWKSKESPYYDKIAWREQIHRFLEHLIDGLSTEEALKKIR